MARPISSVRWNRSPDATLPAHAEPLWPAVRPNASARLAQAYPLARTIHFVLENLRRTPAVLWCAISARPPMPLWRGFTIHHTPKHASWLNQAEIEISIFARQCLGVRRIASLPALLAESKARDRTVNRQRLKINWSFSRLGAANVFHQQLQLFKRSRR